MFFIRGEFYYFYPFTQFPLSPFIFISHALSVCVDWVFSFDFGVVNFLGFACTCAWSNSQLSSIRISFFGFNFSMASAPPAVLILGHSFVRRLSSDLRSNFDACAAKHFNLLGDAVIHLHGVGSRTLKKFRLFVLGVVSALKPDVIILEIGANDLVADHPEVVGSEIDDLVQLLLQSSSVRVIGVCEVIPRVRAPFFNAAAPILNQYLTDVLQLCPNVFSWHRTGFSNPTVRPYLPDGVHLNPQGQYSLYRSYRGTILKALRSL